MTMTHWEVASAVCGVTYFIAWSASFYPQMILNYQRKTSLGLSPDYVLVNPVGFLALVVWSFGAYFSKTARDQYKERMDGHLPQVSASDLAFAAHAMVVSLITLMQSAWYFYRARQEQKKPTVGERNPLLSNKDAELNSAPTRPSLAARVGLVTIAIASLYEITSYVMGRTELLDVLYFAAGVKLVITMTKYIPQVLLNYEFKNAKGFAIGAVACDCIGGVFSLLQLVISAVFIDGKPAGIIANPGKLGLSVLSIFFDLVFFVQAFILYPNSDDDEDDDEF